MKKAGVFLVFVLAVGMSGFGQDRNSVDEIQYMSDGTKYIIHPSNIRSGGPPPDGIPSIDDPVFETVDEADAWLSDEEWVIVMQRKDIVRIYPLDILVWHEIVNDTIAGDPVLITYCPLCGSAIAFSREIDGQAVEFGTSGKLYNSNLIMYDRLTDSYWTQIGGRAVVGELTGTELKPISINTVTWGAWKTRYPDAEVLSRETGYSRRYGQDPYGNYYSDRSLFFPVENEDARLHPKEVVYGIEVNGVYKAYPESEIAGAGRIDDRVGGAPIVILEDGRGGVIFSHAANGDEIVKERDFWFAWAAFYPETLLYQAGK